MESSKVRELGSAELKEQTRKAAEQLFRIRFQMSLGHKEGVKRLLELKKDIARFKTIERERTLGIRGAGSENASQAGGNSSMRRRQAGTGEAS